VGKAFPLSVFILTKNEVDRVEETISAIRDLTDDLIVIDSGSTDGTQELCERLGARVIYNPWPGYGMQKRFGEEQCRHDWMLNLDADEVVPPDLAAEIKALFVHGEPAKDAYKLRIGELFPGETGVHPWGYTLAPIRLYKRSKGRYSPSTVHDRVVLGPGVKVGSLKGIIRHRSVRSLGAEINKLNSYSDQQVDDLDMRGITLPTWRVFFELPAAFLKAYIGRRHFVRGTYGFLTAMNYAISRHIRLAKHYERRRRGPTS
jgi:glycosyltransferase involved in cell wall biosynthesis